MTAPRIPSGLRPIAGQYSAGAAGGVMRTELEGGAPRYALAYDRGLQEFSVTLMLTAVPFAIWNTFYHRSISRGAISFTMPLDSGYGESDHLVNIIPDTYSATRTQGVITVVSFQVEAENQSYQLTGAEADALLALFEEYGEAYPALLSRLATFANSDTLVLDF